jgi:hypothetical protein
MSEQSMKHKGDLEFPNHKVNVAEQRIETVGQSVFLCGGGKQQRNRVDGATERKFLIKATIATSYEEAIRATAFTSESQHIEDD